MSDLTAGLLVLVGIAVYASGPTGTDVPGLGSVRSRACAVFLLGIFACGVGARRDALESGFIRGRQVAALNGMGGLTFVAGIIAVAFGSNLFLTAMVAGMAVLWAGATLRHLLTSPVPDIPWVSDIHRQQPVKR